MMVKLWFLQLTVCDCTHKESQWDSIQVQHLATGSCRQNSLISMCREISPVLLPLVYSGTCNQWSINSNVFVKVLLMKQIINSVNWHEIRALPPQPWDGHNALHWHCSCMPSLVTKKPNLQSALQQIVMPVSPWIVFYFCFCFFFSRGFYRHYGINFSNTMECTGA